MLDGYIGRPEQIHADGFPRKVLITVHLEGSIALSIICPRHVAFMVNTICHAVLQQAAPAASGESPFSWRPRKPMPEALSDSSNGNWPNQRCY